mmetsp:Transcript_46477/g.119947  ORF Transcript_46477/g.119947 Transcript_46477/m.119947 type:complete len:189 (-) Transcript_46477:91-657(-)
MPCRPFYSSSCYPLFTHIIYSFRLLFPTLLISRIASAPPSIPAHLSLSHICTCMRAAFPPTLLSPFSLLILDVLHHDERDSADGEKTESALHAAGTARILLLCCTLLFQASVRSIAKWLRLGLLASAKVGSPGLFHCDLLWLDAAAEGFVASIAERLLLGATASAVVVVFACLQSDLEGSLSGYDLVS